MELLKSMWDYLSAHLGDVAGYIWDHITLCAASVSIAFVFAVGFSLICRQFHKIGLMIIGFFNMAYAIPSIAMLSFLLPFTGLGKPTAIACIVIYEQFLLIKNIMIGFDSVSAITIEAANGLGMSSAQQFWQIKLPLALPAIINGLKLAMLSAIGIAVLGAFISAGGIGLLITDGMRRDYPAELVWGTIFSTGLAIFFNQLFQWLEKLALHKARGGFILSRGKKTEKA
ncbi:MAG: ABC transporter permease [Synergistaceae bacterium]|jgi:osmoprotectant transport system permease protein|nr:ABC transporter permease [Synergistaceae bacterium]